MTEEDKKRPLELTLLEEQILRDMIRWYAKVLRYSWEPKLKDKKVDEKEKDVIKKLFEMFDKSKL